MRSRFDFLRTANQEEDSFSSFFLRSVKRPLYEDCRGIEKKYREKDYPAVLSRGRVIGESMAQYLCEMLSIGRKAGNFNGYLEALEKMRKTPFASDSFDSLIDGLHIIRIPGNVGAHAETDKKFSLEHECERVMLALVQGIQETDEFTEFYRRMFISKLADFQNWSVIIEKNISENSFFLTPVIKSDTFFIMDEKYRFSYEWAKIGDKGEEKIEKSSFRLGLGKDTAPGNSYRCYITRRDTGSGEQVTILGDSPVIEEKDFQCVVKPDYAALNMGADKVEIIAQTSKKYSSEINGRRKKWSVQDVKKTVSFEYEESDIFRVRVSKQEILDRTVVLTVGSPKEEQDTFFSSEPLTYAVIGMLSEEHEEQLKQLLDAYVAGRRDEASIDAEIASTWVNYQDLITQINSRSTEYYYAMGRNHENNVGKCIRLQELAEHLYKVYDPDKIMYPYMLSILGNVLRCYEDLKNYEDRISWMIRIRKFVRDNYVGQIRYDYSKFSGDNPTVFFYVSIGKIFSRCTMLEQSEDYYVRALNICRADIRGMNEKPLLQFARNTNNLAILYRRCFQLDKADDLYQISYETRTKIRNYTPEKMSVLKINYSQIKIFAGEYDEAEEMIHFALKTRGWKNGGNHRERTASLKNPKERIKLQSTALMELQLLVARMFAEDREKGTKDLARLAEVRDWFEKEIREPAEEILKENKVDFEEKHENLFDHYFNSGIYYYLCNAYEDSFQAFRQGAELLKRHIDTLNRTQYDRSIFESSLGKRGLELGELIYGEYYAYALMGQAMAGRKYRKDHAWVRDTYAVPARNMLFGLYEKNRASMKFIYARFLLLYVLFAREQEEAKSLKPLLNKAERLLKQHMEENGEITRTVVEPMLRLTGRLKEAVKDREKGKKEKTSGNDAAEYDTKWLLSLFMCRI